MAAAAMLSACAVAVDEAVPDPDPEDEGQAVSALVGGPCPEAGCMENSPVIDTLGFHDLLLDGYPNKQGFFIPPYKTGPSKFEKGSATYELRVVNAMIGGYRNNVLVLAHRDLIGSTIKVQRGQTMYTLRIRDVRWMQYFTAPYNWIETYKLEWAKDPDDSFVNLCGGIQILLDEGLGLEGKVEPELMNMEVWEAVLFEGDEINTKFKTISKTANDKRINIGCATSTPAKLLLTHHTIHSQSPLIWERRQAMFKMYVADYCGTGDSFTVARQKLVWQTPLVPYLVTPWKLEARWTETGATCLNNPRMLYPSTPAGPVYFPNISAALNAAGCQPLSCLNLDPFDYAGAQVVSSNPRP